MTIIVEMIKYFEWKFYIWLNRIMFYTWYLQEIKDNLNKLFFFEIASLDSYVNLFCQRNNENSNDETIVLSNSIATIHKCEHAAQLLLRIRFER